LNILVFARATIFVSAASGVPTMSLHARVHRAAVGENFVNDQWEHLEGLRLSAAGERKSAGDIVDQQSVGFALRFDQFDQLRAELRVRDVLLLWTIRLP